MDPSTDLPDRLSGLLRAQGAASFFLNGPPGSGKSHLLRELVDVLPKVVPRSHVLGPYSLRWDEVGSLGQCVLRDCQAAGFLDGPPPADQRTDLLSAWRWFSAQAVDEESRSFLVLVDLAAAQPDYPAMGQLFSAVRRLEGARNPGEPRVLYLIAGHWDQPDLEAYYRRIETSFPYTTGQNCDVWEGITAADMAALLQQERPDEAYPLLGQTLFELTGGHPAAALEIVQQIPAGQLKLRALLRATERAAKDGAAAQALLRAWQRLPLATRTVVRQLLLQRHGAATIAAEHVDRLLTTGIARRDRVGGGYYLSFRSWYAELLVRQHLSELDLADERSAVVQLDQLIPAIAALNVEAYRLIHDIENTVRNFVTIQLCLQQDAAASHILTGRVQQSRYDARGQRVYEDAYQRAAEWQARSVQRGLPTEFNPLLVYCSTGDLAALVDEINLQLRRPGWSSIAAALRNLQGLRDAVMHNQVLSDDALEQLAELRAAIYECLSALAAGPAE